MLECIRNNEYLCAEKLPRDLFDQFGELLNGEPEPSTSPILEFFLIACLPEGCAGNAIVRNQESSIEVLLSPKLDKIRTTIRSVFGEGALCKAPAKVCKVLVALIAQGNKLTPAQLQSNDLTLDKAAAQLAKEVEKAGGDGRTLAKSSYAWGLMNLLGAY